MKTPGFYSDPHVQFLSQLLDEIGEGGLQVPRFQRPLVWKWDRRLELLRSIREGIPIGAIMVWRTNTVEIDCYARLGPYLLAAPSEGSARQYILDGVQRLSTLYGALHRPPPVSDDYDASQLEEILETAEVDSSNVGSFDVFFDPQRREFINPADCDEASGPLMPLYVVFDSLALLRYQRTLTDAGLDNLVAATDEIARAFRDYKLPVIPITTNDINLATRTFQRINSQGARMSETHMVHALTWQPNFDLQKKLIGLKHEVLEPRLWASLDDDPILKAAKAAFNLDVYKSSADELSRSLVVRPEVINEVFASIAKVADFLWEDCGIRSPDMVPYALQVVVLSEAFRRDPAPSQAVRETLRAWLWITTYGELFAGMSGDRVQVAIADMRRTMDTGTGAWTWRRPFEARPLRATFDFRAARAKAFAFHLASQQDAVFGSRFGTNVLADAGRRGVAQVIPWATAKKDAYSSPANRFLVHPADFAAFRDRLLGGLLQPIEMQAHMISAKAMAALHSGDVGTFIALRMKDIESSEHEFLRQQLTSFGMPLVSSVLAKPIDVIETTPGITLLRQEGDSYTISIGDLHTPVSISLTHFGDMCYFFLSHFIFTPVQADVYIPSRPIEESPVDAMRAAVRALKVFYDQAVEKGHAPVEEWLVERRHVDDDD